jgi:hypothetical protein
MKTAEAEATAADWPRDASAWWAFGSATLGGLALVQARAPQRMAEALCLAFAFACLFAASDWISSLSGKSLAGDVAPGRFWASYQPLLLLLGATSLAWFWHLQAPEQARFWMTALASGAALIILMFLLRLDLEPHDLRLLALSSLLCTAPALYLAFLAQDGQGSPAWAFWAAPALYFPVNAVFAWIWLQGLYRSSTHLALLAAPILLLVLLSLSQGRRVETMTFLAYLGYLLVRLQERYRQGAHRLPQFSDIRSLGREQMVWNSLVGLAWLLGRVSR